MRKTKHQIFKNAWHSEMEQICATRGTKQMEQALCHTKCVAQILFHAWHKNLLCATRGTAFVPRKMRGTNAVPRQICATRGTKSCSMSLCVAFRVAQACSMRAQKKLLG